MTRLRENQDRAAQAAAARRAAEQLRLTAAQRATAAPGAGRRPPRHPHNQRLPRTAGPAPGGVRVELGGRDFGRNGEQRRTGRVYRRGPRRLSGDP
ncbi:MAG TPA: hypothetical protein VII33_16805 [Nakamurella sp.]